MRNGQSLTILYPADLSFRLFRDNCVSVKVKTPPVIADQNHPVLPKCANIEFGRINRAQYAGFKLQISHRGQCRWRGHRWSAGVSLWNRLSLCSDLASD